MKTSNNETRVKKAINMINCGATWNQVCEALNLSKGYIQKIVKRTYKTEKGYNNLLAKAKANKKAINEAASAITDTESNCKKNNVKEVVVVETGYLLNKGYEGILEEGLELFIPYFCIKELEKLTYCLRDAEPIINMLYRTNAITPINLWGKEQLFEEPSESVKDRTYGVVAVCCYLWNKGYHVRLMTNSREIEKLANEQGTNGICVVRVS